MNSPDCAKCRYSVQGYDALLCTYGVTAKTVATNRDPRGLCGPAGVKFIPKGKK